MAVEREREERKEIQRAAEVEGSWGLRRRVSRMKAVRMGVGVRLCGEADLERRFLVGDRVTDLALRFRLREVLAPL